ncbi:proline racemase family protein [Euzebya sp.]|uniref:proline racemase family protein n=1 Tax=Euzebya sp. TaxID=1971409 RepID=UPI0035154A58
MAASLTPDPVTTITTEDYHTGGEPFRIVTGGVPEPEGSTVAERRLWAVEHLQDVRRLLVNEPRGHADMYGCIVTPPDDDGADLGCLFFHNDGFSTACGHGTIALATWAVETGRVRATAGEGEVRMVIDVPSGRLPVRIPLDDDGRPAGVVFRNVPSFVAGAQIIEHGGQHLAVTVAFGGAFYGIVDAGLAGLRVVPEELGAIIALARDLKAELNRTPWVHPEDPRLSGIYGIIVVDEPDPDDPPLEEVRVRLGDPAEAVVVQRNVTVFADGEVDRSPTGSGTSARLAALHELDDLPAGAVLVNRSIVGSVMLGVVEDDEPVMVGPHRGYSTLVAGQAFRTGSHTFTLDPRDPFATGFLLR